jgi:hypothetical protein
MSNLGIFASRFNVSSDLLREFDEALLFIRGKREIVRTHEVAEKINNLLKVLAPISDGIGGRLSQSTFITERSIIDILEEQHSQEWPSVKENILKLTSKLSSEKFQLSQEDFKLLNDVADALDLECANLFKRMGER